MKNKRCIVTGGCGFIGSALVRSLCRDGAEVLVIDKLTYAGVRESLSEVDGAYELLQADICDRSAVSAAFRGFDPDCIYHLAAESHVDRSIDSPLEFVRTNVEGTANLLSVSLEHYRRRGDFLFQHISTDEVYGALGEDGYFTEATPYSPHSPYSATKASSDHLVRAWHDTYSLPTVITNCSNNYGPYHFPEKLIPLAILNCLELKNINVYGKGLNVRDWLHVEDHVAALRLVNEKGVSGRTYNIGAHCERTNVEVVRAICALMDELRPVPPGGGIGSHFDLVRYVDDRPGHDMRYAIDSSRICNELGWKPRVGFDDGLRATVEWYLANEWWWGPLRRNRYAGARLGGE